MTRRSAPSPVRRSAAALVLFAIWMTACSLPTDDRVVPYNVDDLPPLPSETTTTTSTTTTSTTTTIAADTSVPGESTTTTTTTTLAIETEPVTIYYTLGSTDEMQPLVIQQASEIGPPAIVRLLESPVGLAPLNLRSSVRSGLIDDVAVERGVATIVLDPFVLARMSEAERARAVAQMVLTFTSFSTTDQGNIGFVRFESDGEHYEVFVPAFGGSSEPGEELAFEDFSSLIATTATPSTTTTTPTPTSPPPTDPEGTAA